MITTALRLGALCFLLAPLAVLQAGETGPIVGAIRWDAWYGKGSVTKAVEASLGQPKYHFRLPWFARVIGEEKVSINGDSQAIVEQEIDYAAKAGLNYWAFVDYCDEASDMHIALNRYRNAKDKKGIRYCFVEEGPRLDGIGTAAWKRLVEHFRHPDYQTVVDGRPLLFVFVKTTRLGKSDWDELKRLTLNAGMKAPYLVLMGWNPEEDAKDMAALGFDAISAYARGGSYSMTHPSYAEQCALVRRDRWEKCRALRIPSVTFASAGWDTRPRNERPPPWVTWVAATPDKTPGAQQKPLIDSVTATPDELAAHIREAVEWTKANRDINPANAIIIYGWNENDEGGWLQPTLGPDGRADEARVKALGQVLFPSQPGKLSVHAGDGPATVAKDAATQAVWATITPPEFQGAINNPLKGFRDYKKGGYGLLKRTYIPWNVIERGADDGVERIIAHINEIAKSGGQRFEELNVKLVPRVYLDWDGTPGTPQKPKQHWPADLHTFDYDSPAFQERLKALVAKLGKAWDDDPRIFAVQMGLIGYWGEHHHPAPTAEQRRLLTDAFQKAFKNKPVLVRHTDREFMEAGFGIYYDTFANIAREPPTDAKDQFPWQATQVHRDIWKRAPIEGEVEYNWQQQRESAKPTETFGRTPDETMKVPAYRRYMLDKIRRYHSSYLGWIGNYNAAYRDVLAGAAEIQKAFGYRFVLDSVSYPRAVQPGGTLAVKLAVRNTGSAPFYLDWPVAVALLDAATKKPVWSAPLNGVDIRRWLPGEDWDSAAFSYRSPAKTNDAAGEAALPPDLKTGEYILALAILDRQGGMTPSVRFATENYFRGGWHPFGFIGVGGAPQEVALKNITFDSPAFDDSLRYNVPEKLLAVRPPPVPAVKAVAPWTPNPKLELINPWRYWILEARSSSLEKWTRADGPVEGPAGRRVIGVEGDFGRNSSLYYTFSNDGKLAAGRYRFACRVRGPAGKSVVFEAADGWRGLPPGTTIPLTSEWREHVVEFELRNPFKDEPRLRFMLPHEAAGTFELTDIHLRESDNSLPSPK